MPASPIRVEGTEGGGPLVRAALSLSLASGAPFSMERIGAASQRPGLDAGLLGCIRAAQAVSSARVEGAEAGSSRLIFEPGPVRAGDYLLDLGPGGSVPQAVQVVSVPLGLTGGISVLKLRGGTHLSGGVPFHYLSLIWQPMMRELGFDLELELSAAGWSEEGGGEATLTLRPVLDVDPFERRGRGMLREARILSLVSNLPFSTACRQSERALQRLKEKGVLAEAENIPVPAPRSCGSMCMITGFFERGRAGFASLGGAQAIAEGVADEAASDFVQFIEGRSAIDPCLAEQLLVPAAVAAAGLRGASRPITRFTTPCVTDALVATASAIGRFLEDVEVAILASADGEAEVRVAPRGESLMAALQGRAGHVKPSS